MTNDSSWAATGPDENRRDFLLAATCTLGMIGAGLAAWPFIDSLNPSADAQALASVEVDLSSIAPGQAVTAAWQGKPVFIRHRTRDEIVAAREVHHEDLPDPQRDADRAQNPRWLVVIGVCTHLGCIPRGQKPGDPRGKFDGWFCSCHGSQFDTSGRVRTGPAPRNLAVPPHSFPNGHTLRIG